MPAWLQDLRHRAQNRSNSLAHHIPFYQKWCLRRELRRQEKDLPKPLKPRRAHQNLSTMAVNTISNAQPECLLLSRLPAELRLQIYEEVFRDDGYKKPSHISIVKGRLAALPMCADCGCENHDDVCLPNTDYQTSMYLLTHQSGNRAATSLHIEDLPPNLLGSNNSPLFDLGLSHSRHGHNYSSFPHDSSTAFCHHQITVPTAFCMLQSRAVLTARVRLGNHHDGDDRIKKFHGGLELLPLP